MSSSDDSIEGSDTEDVKHTLNNKESEATNQAKKDGSTNGTDAPMIKIDSPKKKPSSPIAVNPAKLSPKIGEFFFVLFCVFVQCTWNWLRSSFGCHQSLLLKILTQKSKSVA